MGGEGACSGAARRGAYILRIERTQGWDGRRWGGLSGGPRGSRAVVLSEGGIAGGAGHGRVVNGPLQPWDRMGEGQRLATSQSAFGPPTPRRPPPPPAPPPPPPSVTPPHTALVNPSGGNLRSPARAKSNHARAYRPPSCNSVAGKVRWPGFTPCPVIGPPPGQGTLHHVWHQIMAMPCVMYVC